MQQEINSKEVVSVTFNDKLKTLILASYVKRIAKKLARIPTEVNK
jgi:hypothetical protein